MKKIKVLTICLILFSSLFLVLIPDVSASDTLLDSYSESYYDAYVPLYIVHPSSNSLLSAGGQCFTTPATTIYKITSCKFYLRKVGSPTGYFNAQLYEITGTYGTNGVPTGSALAISNTFSCSQLPASGFQMFEFTFNTSNQYSMQTSHHYGICIVAITTGFSNGNGVGIAYDASSATHNGNLFDYDNNLWRLGAYGGSGKDICFYVYGIVAGGIKFQNLAYSSNENGINCIFSVDCTPIDALATMSGYIFSYDISGSYVNDTWLSFSNTISETLNINKILIGTLGQVVHFTFFGNDSNNIWTQSSISSLTIQATVTFRFTEGGALWRNSISIANGTSTTYTTSTNLTMLALESSLYGFYSFNWTNSISSSTTNNYGFVVTNQSTFWAYMNLTETIFLGNATINDVLQNQTFYSTSHTLLTGNLTQTGTAPDLSDYTTINDAIAVVVIAVIIACITIFIAFKKR